VKNNENPLLFSNTNDFVEQIETPSNHLKQVFCHLGNGSSIHLSYGSNRREAN
jgi:acetate kinase